MAVSKNCQITMPETDTKARLTIAVIMPYHDFIATQSISRSVLSSESPYIRSLFASLTPLYEPYCSNAQVVPLQLRELYSKLPSNGYSHTIAKHART